MEESRTELLDKLTFWGLIGLSFLLPLFVIPGNQLGLDVNKGALFFIGVTLVFGLWVVGRLIDGTFSLPKSPLLAAASLMVVAGLVSSALSPAPMVSFVGQAFELTTFMATLVGVLTLLLSSLLFQSRDRVFYLYGAVAAAAVAVALFQGARLIWGADVLSLGVFTSSVSNLLGKWNDLGIFFGLSAVLALTTLELFSQNRLFNFFLYALLVISLFFVTLVNFTLGWIVLGLSALVIVIYGVYANRYESLAATITLKKIRVPIASLLTLVVSFIFIIAPTSLGAYLPTKLGISQVEVRPSLQATLEVAKSSLTGRDIIFGAGPNRFVNEWLLHKPAGINESIFWNTDFNFGFGIIPTVLVTHGVFGLGAWLLFLAALLYAGFKTMFNFGLSRVTRYLSVSAFLLSAYLWAFVALYVPSAALMGLAFIFSGAFVAILASEGMIGSFKISLLGGEPKLGFASVLLLIFLVIGAVSMEFLFTQQAFALNYFQKSLVALNQGGSVEDTENYLAKAVLLDDSDTYRRAMAELGLIKLNDLVNQSPVPQETLRTQFQVILGSAIDNGKRAVALDATNYANHMSIGRVYEAIVPLGIAGSYEAAKDSYLGAAKLNPESPAILLSMARLEIANKDIKAARKLIADALAKKPNYTEAIFFLAQLEASQGNAAEAIRRTEEASLLAPNDVSVFFQLGLLKYNSRDYAGAITALERAVTLSPNYSNAKYFLGLAYSKTGRRADALKEFEEVQALNPDNEEVANIITNLKANRDPFANVPPPDNKPETRKKPPIQDEE